MKQEFGKDKFTKGIAIAFAVVCGIPALILLFSAEGQMKVSALFIFAIAILPLLSVYSQKLIIEDEHITIKSGIIFKTSEDIKYKKINNIKVTNALWMGSLEIMVGNDKPIKFKHIEQYDLVKKLINEKIDN